MKQGVTQVITSVFPHFYVLSVMCLARLGSNGNLLCRCGSWCTQWSGWTLPSTSENRDRDIRRSPEDMCSLVHGAFVPSDLFTLIHIMLKCTNLECWLLVSSCRSNCISSGNYIFLLFTITLLLCSMLWCSFVWLRCLGTRIPTSSFRNLIRPVFHDPLGVKAVPSFFWIQLNFPPNAVRF